MRFFLVALFIGSLFGLATEHASAQAKPIEVTLGEDLEVRGMDCVPQVKEVELRRSIPLACETDYAVAGVELRYLAPGKKKWEKVELEKTDAGYQGSIPCSATHQRGALKVYVFARNENNKVVARVGRRENPMNIRLVEHSNLPPPALPNQSAPERCYDQKDCPPEMLGTSACPGTKASASGAGKSEKRAWGQSCNLTSECQAGLECVNGNCETPAKCERTDDCPSGGECVDGLCHVPDAEEIAQRLGPPKHHWVGLHAGPDLMLMREGSDVCGNVSEDSKSFACYQGGGAYTGTPNVTAQGHLSSGLYLATIRALLSYDYAIGRIMVGGRIGWAFRGAPDDFSPVHVEARFLYAMRKDPLDKRFRPYLGIAAGHAQVDASGPVDIVDCTSPDLNARSDCANEANPAVVEQYYLAAGPNVAVRKTLNAYRTGSSFFFGPTLMMVFALTNESAIVFNLNTMFPDVVFEPTIGYSMGL